MVMTMLRRIAGTTATEDTRRRDGFNGDKDWPIKLVLLLWDKSSVSSPEMQVAGSIRSANRSIRAAMFDRRDAEDAENKDKQI
jgi:hypothetical protein